ncbi:MAG: hypothetical protein IM583_04065 [Pseudanabaena sp. M114S2SP2A07QC]|nr:hypothetical protein [Pseudanabaena sp. M110S1SP2A07QC]MCA6545284.1 hypothetical protein [Pseudanabaena sp. M074S1SP2A07QC]MCA6555813.1 hypothetical protein [Pseudanabaena sp. M114S2SP2A07QC]
MWIKEHYASVSNSFRVGTGYPRHRRLPMHELWSTSSDRLSFLNLGVLDILFLKVLNSTGKGNASVLALSR